MTTLRDYLDYYVTCAMERTRRYVRWVQQAQLRRAVTMTQQPTESLQRFATNLLEQIKIWEEIGGPLVPVRDVVKRVQQTRVVGEGDDAVTETYTVAVLADEDVIYKARDQFVACLFSRRSGQRQVQGCYR